MELVYIFCCTFLPVDIALNIALLVIEVKKRKEKKHNEAKENEKA